jgi:hypothetical protein
VDWVGARRSFGSSEGLILGIVIGEEIGDFYIEGEGVIWSWRCVVCVMKMDMILY